jgi:tocopherol cyclase
MNENKIYLLILFMNTIKKIKAFFNPEQFQGWGKTRNYFEGWYYKIVNPDGSGIFAIIPGIAMDGNGNRHAFVQVLDGSNHTSGYHRFEPEAFIATPGKLEIMIGENYFSDSMFKINLPQIRGEVVFSNTVKWPKSWYSPGIMGPFSFVPFMECYHGIVSMDHTLNGSIETAQGRIDFSGGRGYIEKDWGRSFPNAYVWMQSNHFSIPGISFKASVARIPWIGSSFTGFIAGLWLNNQLIRFTTYNRSKLNRLSINFNQVIIVLENRQFLLEITAQRNKVAALASPIKGFMDGRIEESMSSVINIRLTDKKNSGIIFEDNGYYSCLEVAGDIEQIIVEK